MKLVSTEIPEVKLITPTIWPDDRGYFFESYNHSKFHELTRGEEQIQFIQDNEAKSARGTVRGLHYQLPPFAQTKLVRVVQGSVLDVAVDIRVGSPTFGKFVAVELSEQNKLQLLIPAGFAHGYVALKPDTVFLYKVDQPYNRNSERGISFADPDLDIPWGISKSEMLVSEKDKLLPTLRELKDTGFNY